MAQNHYVTLGIDPKSTPDQVKSAYRKIAREHHPDLSKDPTSAEIFMKATEAYDILIDESKRRLYDVEIRTERVKQEQERLRQSDQQRRSKQSVNKGQVQAKTEPLKQQGPNFPNSKTPQDAQFQQTPSTNSSVSVNVTRMTILFNQGRTHDAETLAMKILRQDPRQPIPYAVLGDIRRQQGLMPKATEMYAMAVQMDPHNDIYRDRYEELVQISIRPSKGGQNVDADSISSKAQTYALLAALTVTVLGSVFIVLSRETPVFRGWPIIGSWTIGLVVMLFLSGVAIGASMSIAGMLDRFTSLAVTSIGRTSPAVVLAVVAVVNFWAAAILYAIIGLTQGAFNYSTTRIVVAVGAATTLIALACSFGQVIQPIQSFLWGGNLCYLGSLCGWMVADSLGR